MRRKGGGAAHKVERLIVKVTWTEAMIVSNIYSYFRKTQSVKKTDWSYLGRSQFHKISKSPEISHFKREIETVRMKRQTTCPKYKHMILKEWLWETDRMLSGCWRSRHCFHLCSNTERWNPSGNKSIKTVSVKELCINDQWVGTWFVFKKILFLLCKFYAFIIYLMSF